MKINYYSETGTIMRGFKDTKGPLKVSFFTHRPYFVGYEAGTCVSDLCREGLIERIGTEETLGKRYALYAITQKGRELVIEKPSLIERIQKLIF